MLKTIFCSSGIAVADVLVMIEYIPFTVHMYILDEVGPTCLYVLEYQVSNPPFPLPFSDEGKIWPILVGVGTVHSLTYFLSS
jgi:hypothetical protein